MKKLFIFYKVYDALGDSSEVDTALILSEDYNTALELCEKQFNPDSYHEVSLDIINKLANVPIFKTTLIVNNSDLKEV